MKRYLTAALLIALLAGCQKPDQKPAAAATPAAAAATQPNTPGATKEYKIEGKVIQVDKNSKTAVIQNKDIPGFMEPMTMSYPVPDQADLDKIQAGDQISATLFKTDEKYWIANVQHSK
jgi:Cu/Ag efflux protein CusF